MSEDALVGKACLCVPRRLFVALVAALWCIWYIGDIGAYMIWYPMIPSPPPRACTSHKCLEVFSCLGMQDATFHIREPFLLLGGIIFGGLGLHGAVAVNHKHLKYFAYFLLAVSAMYVLNIIFDGIFLASCEHYPSNVIHEVLLSTPLSDIKNVPILEEKKRNLEGLGDVSSTSRELVGREQCMEMVLLTFRVLCCSCPLLFPRHHDLVKDLH